MNKVPVVFVCDENYAMPTAVAITSIKFHKNEQTAYDVYVIGKELSDASKEKISSISAPGFSVSIVERELSEKQKSVVQHRERVTAAAIFKFDIPNIFPYLSKIIYLDSDVVVQQDLSELFSIEIPNQYAAVVKDIITLRRGGKHLKWLHFKEKAYFNSGVMLLNLEKMREDGIPEKLLDYRINGLNHFMDQDALNVVFSDKVKYISVYYNMLNCFFEWHNAQTLSRFYQECLSNAPVQNYKKATVLHFGDKKKPWQYNMGYLSRRWKSYYKRSPYASIPLCLQRVPLAERNANSLFSKCIRAAQKGRRYYQKHGFLRTVRKGISKILR